MKCPVCGATVKEGGSFCPECGAKVEEVAQDAYVTPETVFSAPSGAAPDVTEPVHLPADATASAPLSEKEQLAQDKEAYKTAKAEYKRAREHLGKSYAPMVALIVVVGLLGCAASAGGMYSYLQAHPQNDAAIEKLQKQLDASKDEVKSLKDQLKAAEAKAAGSESDDGANSSDASGATDDASTTTSTSASAVDTTDPTTFVGTWKGSLKSTKASWDHLCYGADKNDLVIVIKSVSKTGKVVADISATVHAHDTYDASHAADSNDGDSYQTYKDVTGTFTTDDGLSFEVPTGKDGVKLTIEGKPVREGDKVLLRLDVQTGVSNGKIAPQGTRINDDFDLELQES